METPCLDGTNGANPTGARVAERTVTAWYSKLRRRDALEHRAVRDAATACEFLAGA
ncbi:MAG TPA: hypothetical protein VG860_21265 [Terriglobia bacterium]|nr:hypothetical protein [Terriglobia bacterium]